MLCVIAKIDSSARERLIKLHQIAERFGIPPRNVDGHITLATYIGHEEDRFISFCKAILAGHAKFSICFDKIEVFASSSVIVAVPQAENAMAAIQKEIARQWAADLNEWTQEHTWHAHTTLVNDPQADLCTIAELNVIAEAMQENLGSLVAQVDGIEFTRRYEDGFKRIDFIELREK